MPRKLQVEDGKRYAAATRTSLRLNTLLKQAAAASGRSVAQEIEMRLEASFEHEEMLALMQQAMRAALAEVGMKARKPCGREIGSHCSNQAPFTHQCACEQAHRPVDLGPYAGLGGVAPQGVGAYTVDQSGKLRRIG